MKTIKVILITACILSLASCKQKEIMIYENDPKVYFELPGQGGIGIRDSLVYSFPITEAAETELTVRVRLMGQASPTARAISFGVVQDETTATADNYSLPSAIELPADAYLVDVPVTIKRAGLKDRSVVLVLEIKDNQNFTAGFERGRKTKLVWGDMYLKPDNWDSTIYLACWGEFSQVKYGFILETCKITELPLPTDIYTLGYYNAKVREALYEYNLNNPPLMDENEGLVIIPVWNGGGGGVG